MIKNLLSTNLKERFYFFFIQLPSLKSEFKPRLVQYLALSFQTFKTGYGQILTLNIVEMNKEEAASGTLTVMDGDSDSDKVLAKIPIINGTMPQGITSTRNIMGIKFEWNRLPSDCPRLIDCIKFTIIMDSGKGKTPLCSFHFPHLKQYSYQNDRSDKDCKRV